MKTRRRVAAGTCGVVCAGLLLWPGSPAETERAVRGPLAAQSAVSPAESDLWLAPTAAEEARAPLARPLEQLAAGNPRPDLAPLEQATADPVIGPYARLRLGRASLVQMHPDDAIAAAQSVLETRPGGYLGEAALWLLVDAQEQAERWSDAFVTLQALADTAQEPQRALLRLGRVAQKVGDDAQARDAFERVYYDFPLSESAREAATALEAWPKADSPEQVARDLERARRLFAGGRDADARAAWLDVRRHLSGEERALADLRIATCDVRTKRYRAALDRLGPLLDRRWDRRAEVEFVHLGALRGLGRGAEYVARARAFLDAFPDDPLAARVLDELGTYYIIGDEDAQAAAVFAEAYARYPESPTADRAAWKAGWWAYRQGDDREAVRIFASAAERMRRADYRPSWLYWAGRASQRQGDLAAAARFYRQAIADYGNSYYGREAEGRLEAMTGDGETASVAPAVALRDVPIVTPVDPPSNAALVRRLLQAGLYEDAIGELRAEQRASGTTPVIEASIAYALNRLGQLRPAITLMRRAYPQFIAAGGDALPRRLLEVIFPIRHWDLLQRYGAQHDLDPYLLAAQVAQESTFQADVRSAANAYGLMQILPATGRRYAVRLGIGRFSTARLTDPETNVRIGTAYLASLVDQLGGVVPALAAYNAGENRVVVWQAERPGLPQDEFIDDIPYPETQFYVKRILGTAVDYRNLYGEARPGPSMTAASGAAPARR